MKSNQFEHTQSNLLNSVANNLQGKGGLRWPAVPVLNNSTVRQMASEKQGSSTLGQQSVRENSAKVIQRRVVGLPNGRRIVTETKSKSELLNIVSSVEPGSNAYFEILEALDAGEFADDLDLELTEALNEIHESNDLESSNAESDSEESEQRNEPDTIEIRSFRDMRSRDLNEAVRQMIFNKGSRHVGLNRTVLSTFLSLFPARYGHLTLRQIENMDPDDLPIPNLIDQLSQQRRGELHQWLNFLLDNGIFDLSEFLLDYRHSVNLGGANFGTGTIYRFKR